MVKFLASYKPIRLDNIRPMDSATLKSILKKWDGVKILGKVT